MQHICCVAIVEPPVNILCKILGHRHARDRKEIQGDRHWHSECARCATPLIKLPHGWVRDAA